MILDGLRLLTHVNHLEVEQLLLLVAVEVVLVRRIGEMRLRRHLLLLLVMLDSLEDG